MKDKLVDLAISRGYLLIMICSVISVAACKHERPSDNNYSNKNETDISFSYIDSNEVQIISIASANHGWVKELRYRNENLKEQRVLPSFIMDSVEGNIYVSDFGDSLFQLNARTGVVKSKAELPNFQNLVYHTPIKYTLLDSVIIGEIQGQWFLATLGLKYIKHLNPIIEMKELKKAKAIIGDSIIDVVGASSKNQSIMFNDNFTLVDVTADMRKDSLELSARYQSLARVDTIVSYLVSKY